MVNLFKKYVRRIFGEPLANCRAARTMMNKFAYDLEIVAHRLAKGESEGIDEIVIFFQVVSEVHDTGLIKEMFRELSKHKAYERLAGEIDVLNNFLRFLDRHSFGMNRSVKGFPITEADIFLGAYRGHWPKSVKFIKAHRHDVEVYAAMNEQSTLVIQGYSSSMIKAIKKFEQLMEEFHPS